MSGELPVGIDLGTTNSVVAVPFGDSIEVVTNEEGNRRTPSVVSFAEDGAFVGDAAVNRAAQNPSDTVYSIKRQLGSDDYTFVDSRNDTFSAVEISALVLKKLKRDTEAELGREISSAVITVPAYFGNREREETKDAAQIAGLDVDRIINEPTAACLAYGYRDVEEATILMYDLGGGTFDASVVTVSSGIVEVRATDGDSLLGGEDWDARILDTILDRVFEETGWDPESDHAVLQRLWDASQRVKHQLTDQRTASLDIPFLAEVDGRPYNLSMEVTRDEFEEETRDLLDRTLHIVDRLLDDAGYATDDVDDVVLVGGSTRMPMVHDELERMFGEAPDRSVDPDMAVATGAAKQAATLTSKKLPPSESSQGLARVDDVGGESTLLVDVTSKALGTEARVRGRDGRFSELIPRNTTIPERVTNQYWTVQDGQTQVVVKVYQGQKELARENELLGEFELSGIPPAPAGEMSVEVTFELDESGILHVSAQNPAAEVSEDIVIESGVGLSDGKKRRMQRNLPAVK